MLSTVLNTSTIYNITCCQKVQVLLHHIQAKQLLIQIFTLCFFIIQLAHILVFGE